MKGPFCKWVGMISWLVTALVSINAGLRPFNYDFFQTEFAMNNLMGVMTPLHYVVLASGLVSFGLFVMAVSGGHCGCDGCKSCK